MNTSIDSGSCSDRERAEVQEPRGFSSCLPQSAQALRQFGVTLIRAEYQKGELCIRAFGDQRGALTGSAAAMICLEIDQHLSLILRRRYPAHFEGDGSRSVFEWDLLTDTLKHEHTRVHHGL